MNWLAPRSVRFRRDGRRRGPPCRRFTVFDGMILIVVAAVGFTGYRAGLELYSEWYYRVQMNVGATLLLASWLVLIYRFRRPRPSLRLIARQPGAVACFAIVAIHLVQAVESLTTNLTGHNLSSVSSVGLVLWTFLSQSSPALEAVVPIAWALLVAGRGWRPEAGWIDTLGRGIGWAWIAWLVAWPLLYWFETRHDSNTLYQVM